MKYPVLLLILFFLTDPVLATQRTSPGECLLRYQTHLLDLAASQLHADDLMLFADDCMPEASHSQQVEHYRLLRLLDDNKTVFTVQASI